VFCLIVVKENNTILFEVYEDEVDDFLQVFLEMWILAIYLNHFSEDDFLLVQRENQEKVEGKI
jgi:hypothetical protein